MGKIYSICKWQNITDYDKFVQNTNGVICRLGYRGSTTGTLIEDKKFREFVTNLTGKTKIGVYFFSNAINEQEATEEAQFVINTLKSNNISVDFPVFVQVGYGLFDQTGRADKITKMTRTLNVQAFLREIRRNGYTAGIYANEKWINSKLDINLLLDEIKWGIKYVGDSLKVPGKVFAWQKDQYSVDGAEGIINISDYTEDAISTVVSTGIDKSDITRGMNIVLDSAPGYRSSIAEEVTEVLTGNYYTWDAKVIRNRIRITDNEDDIGVRNGYTYWVDINDIIV